MKNSKRRYYNISKPKRGLVIWLAMKDLIFENLITINLIIGTAAIIAPLLILFGIKFGTIETMTNRLVNDPKNLEIRPISSNSYSQNWFTKIKENSYIDFVIPMTRQLSSSVEIASITSKKKLTADLIATDKGDPLLLQNGGEIPKQKSCVLTHTIAKELNLKKGDTLKCTVSRFVNKKIQRKSLSLKIVSILSQRAGFLKSIYVPLDIVENIEKYKDGLAVPQWNWKGKLSEAYPIYDGVFVSVAKKLDRLAQIKLLTGTGFAYIDAIDLVKAQEKAGYSFDSNRYLYFIKPYKNSINDDNLGSLKIKLRGKKAKLYPWVKPIESIIKNGKQEIDIKILALPKNIKKLKPLTLYIFKNSSEVMALASRKAGAKAPVLSNTIMTIKVNQRELTMPIDIQSIDFLQDLSASALQKAGAKAPVPSFERILIDINSSFAFMDVDSIGKLSLLRQRNLHYDLEIKKFLLSKRGYASFRIYAKTLDDVSKLKDFFEEQGISVSTQAERIHEVRELDRYLTLIFWLIAIVGIIGGAATLSASLYSSVERKKKELSILRLIGFSNSMIFRFPIYQGLVISISGVAIALLFFYIMAGIINTLFKTHLQNGESFCTLTITHIGIVFLSAIFLAVVSSGIAAYKTTKTDPAEAMRGE